MKTISIKIVLWLAALVPTAAFGESFHRFHLDHHNGLSSNYIRSIGQDGHGFVWVATIDGLNRFDGNSFRRFSKENSGLSSNELNCLLADPSNPDILWISTRHDGLCKFDYNTCEITRFDGNISTTDIPCLTATSQGKIWVTNYHSVPDLFDPATNTVTPLYERQPDNFPRHVWCAVEDHAGRYLYIGHENNGLTRVNLDTKHFENFVPDADDPQSIKGSTVYCIYIDDSSGIWIGTEKGVSIFDPDSKSFANISHSSKETSILPGHVKSIFEMENGDLWFGTTEGGVSILPVMNRLRREYSFVNIAPSLDKGDNSTQSLSSPTVMVVFGDSYGNKWIGNNNEGIDVFTHEPPFFTITSPFSSYSDLNRKRAVWSMTSDTEGHVWLGGENEIIDLGAVPPKHIRISPANPGYSTIVKALHGDRQGRLWVGTIYSGIYVYGKKHDIVSVINIPENEINCFAENSEGSIWIGTSHGLYKSDDGRTAYPMPIFNSAMPDDYIMSLAVDGDGNLWVGTLGKGVIKFDSKGKLLLSVDATTGLPSNTVNTIMEDRSGNIWLGTREGAMRISGKNPADRRIFGLADGLVSSFIKSAREDRNGNIWFGTNRGIALYTPKDERISVYESTYSSNLESYIENSSIIDAAGRIYFGSLVGLTYFDPKSHSNQQKECNVILTSLVANDSKGTDQNLGIEIPVNSPLITLPYNLNTFTIGFNNPDIAFAANSEYSYNMVGVNEVWTKSIDNNVAIYRNLSPGNYTFQVRHRVNGEEWSEPQVLARITITPPIWLSWWAMILYAVSVSVIVLVVIYFYKHKLNLEKNLAIERENIKNVQSLNNERMVFFTNITHELRTPLSLIIGPIEDLVNDPSINDRNRKKLHMIRTSSMRLLNLINGILEFRKTETSNRKLEVIHGTLANFVREIGLRFKELNSNQNVSIIIDVARMEGVEMFYDPEMINTIINNLMSNAMKYTHTGSITLSLRPENAGGVKYVELSVTDTGTGISKEALPHIFQRYYQASHSRKTAGTGIGLALTKNLVELHQATINVRSEVGKGSTFTVRFLLENSYPEALHREVMDNDGNSEIDNMDAISAEAESKLVLLVVEDDNDMRDYIAQAFAEDFNVVTASNGREGYDIAMSEMPDIIVSDIMMPEMDGMEMCNKLKAEMTTNHIPVILLTAKDTLRDKEKGYESGADSYITKPFSASLLRARINNIIESRHKLSMRLLDISTHVSAQNDIITGPSTSDNDGIAKLSLADRDFITKFSKIVEDNMEMEEFDQTFLADRMCMSHSTLYRKIKSITGLTPNEFIRKIKLHRATELLTDKSLTIADIASMTGFSSVAYFRRLFKKEFGISPSEYTSQSPQSSDSAITYQ